MVRFKIKVQYEVDMVDPDLPQEVLEAMVKQGREMIDLNEDSVLANYIVENVKQEYSLSQSANLQELEEGDNV